MVYTYMYIIYNHVYVCIYIYYICNVYVNLYIYTYIYSIYMMCRALPVTAHNSTLTQYAFRTKA